MNDLVEVRKYIETLSSKLPVYYGLLKYTKPQKYSNLIRIIAIKKYNADVYHATMHHKPITKFL